MPLQDCHSLSKYDPFKNLFWVIQAHFKMCLTRKRTRKCKFSGYKIFLKQYFGLNFRSKVKQEPKSMESNIHKRLNFRGSWALVWINAMGGGGKEKKEIENWWLGQIAPPSWNPGSDTVCDICNKMAQLVSKMCLVGLNVQAFSVLELQKNKQTVANCLQQEEGEEKVCYTFWTQPYLST